MKLFSCTCEARPLLFFDNRFCQSCNRSLGFDCKRLEILPLQPGETPDTWRDEQGQLYRYCRNHGEYDACNWLVDVNDPEAYCRACRLNDMVPDLSNPLHIPLWRAMETEKRRCLYTLLSLGLPIVSRDQDPEGGLAFRFMSDADAASHFRHRRSDKKVVTGHADGMITINLAEADVVARHEHREALHEPYRTLLGHFRHEIGHYYWDLLISNHPQRLDAFRQRFGDERRDYTEALEEHYANGPPADWQQHYISAYAGSHAWEDWAETWAHYLHMIDALDTAQEYGLEMHRFDVSLEENSPLKGMVFDTLFTHWTNLSLALNSLNRSLGLEDPYPFAVATEVREKLLFIHQLITEVTLQSSDQELPA